MSNAYYDGNRIISSTWPLGHTQDITKKTFVRYNFLNNEGILLVFFGGRGLF